MPSTEKTAPQVLTSVGDDAMLKKRVSNSTYALYRKMRKDPTIGLARDLVIAPVLAAEWSVESTDKAPPDAKTFIEDVVLPMRLHILKTATLNNMDYGWSPYEKVLGQTADGKVYIRKLKPLLVDKTDIMVDKATGAFLGLQNTAGESPVILKVDESLLISLDVEGTDWYGESRMERAKDPFDQWNSVNEGADRYDQKIAGAHWIIKYPIGTSTVEGEEVDNFELAKKMLANLKSSGGIVVPKKVQDEIDVLKSNNDAWDIHIESPGGPAQYSFVARQSYIDKLKVRALGLPERSVLEGEFGTKAESETHANLAITFMELRHLLIVQHINWHYVNHMLRLNFGPESENTVYIKPAPLTDVQLQWLQRLYEDIIKTPDGFLGEYDTIDTDAMRDRLSVPQKAQPEQSPSPPSQFRGVEVGEVP